MLIASVLFIHTIHMRKSVYSKGDEKVSSDDFLTLRKSEGNMADSPLLFIYYFISPQFVLCIADVFQTFLVIQ